MHTPQKLFKYTLGLSLLILITIAACQSSTNNRTKVSSGTSTISDSSNQTTEPLKPKNRTVKFLWREAQFDKELNATLNTLVLNKDYASTISDPEKAVLGYVATFVGNECQWDGKATSSRSNLKCKILTALNLGYQCSNTHLDFLRQWFRDDSTVLRKLEGCPTIPDGSTVQETFESIELTMEGNNFVVAYEVHGINIREGKSWYWKAEDHFVLQDNRLQLVKTEKAEPIMEGFKTAPVQALQERRMEP